MTLPASICVSFFVLALFGFLLGCSKRESSGPPAKSSSPQTPATMTNPQFDELSKEDIARLDLQREVVLAAARQRYGTQAFSRTRADLPVLQTMIDDRVFAPTQTYELQCMGVVFGDVLASELPLKWVIVTDEFGTDFTLRYKDLIVNINALTMISKRVETGRLVDLEDLLSKTHEHLAEWDKKYGK